MSQTIPARADVDARFTWNLSDIFPTDDAWREEFARVHAQLDTLRGYQGKLSEHAQTLLRFLRLGDELSLALDKLGNYARRKSDEDTRNAAYQEMSAQFMNLAVETGEASAFETPELLAIPDETLEAFYAAEPALEHYRLALTRVRRQKEHTLSHEGEALLAAAGQLGQAPDDIFSMLNDADMTFPDAVDCDGTRHPVTHGTFIPLMHSPDRVLRQSAFQSLYGVYGQFRNTSAAVLSAQMKQLQFFANARRYPSALHAALDQTEVPVDIYHNLISAVREGLPALHRYVRLRKKLLGVEDLHFYDLYTPIVADEDIRVTYEEAKQLSLEALAPLGEKYLSMLKEGYENRWIDVYENQGKRSGAYSAGAYGVHPYVLLNYTDKLDDAFTLVHEMGHSLHTYLSNETQSVTYANYVIFVAEVASTCNESLLMQHLLNTTTDKRRRAYLINYFLEQFRGTLYRQTMFAEFELWCSEQTRKGEALTAEALSAKYSALNRDYYGEDIVLDPEIALEWARIPHFYYDFYVYQYATGYAAAIALSQRILREGQPAVDDYLHFLSGGCSADPVTLLRGAGVDMASPAPVADALTLFGTLVDELEALTR
ncbi:MAG: oligoendopeptidase F [Butyricicoccus pullicaecorum]|nr:oligoendopeptidase F [Butyricicoccus pullicaecorum]